MWAQVEKDLQQLLAAKIYNVLLLHDAVYRSFLMLAGMGPNFPKDDQIPPPLRENFAKAAKIRAHIIVAEIAGKQALDELTCGAKLVSGEKLTGSPEFYRFWNSEDARGRVGTWWFEPSVMTICKQQAKSVSERRQWLREHLAVSLDWSKMNRIDIMRLGPSDEAPVVVGKGTAQRMWSSSALPEGKAASQDYWPSYDKYFPGGVRQTVFPFIPRARGEDLNQFLSRG